MANYGFDPKTKIYGNISEINTDIHEKKKEKPQVLETNVSGSFKKSHADK